MKRQGDGTGVRKIIIIPPNAITVTMQNYILPSTNSINQL